MAGMRCGTESASVWLCPSRNKEEGSPGPVQEDCPGDGRPRCTAMLGWIERVVPQPPAQNLPEESPAAPQPAKVSRKAESQSPQHPFGGGFGDFTSQHLWSEAVFHPRCQQGRPAQGMLWTARRVSSAKPPTLNLHVEQ